MRTPHLVVVTVSTLFVAALAGCASDKTTTQQAPGSQSASNSATTVNPSSTTATSPTSNAPFKSTSAKPADSSVYFEYDSAQIAGSSTGVVRTEADYLQQSSANVELQGNADERGSRDYNMALGQKRAEAVKRAMTAVGVKSDKITTISYGEDKPKANGHDEKAWAENRRVDFAGK